MQDFDDHSWTLTGAERDTQSALRDPTPPCVQPIEGVFLRNVRPVHTGYGRLTEMSRAEWIGPNQTIDQIFVSSLVPGAVSAWHAHRRTTDRLFVAAGAMLIVLFDNREGSASRGTVTEYRLGAEAPGLLVVPPRIWHGVKNTGPDMAHLINAVDYAYQYESPDHWRVPPDSDAIPYRFA